MIVTRDFIMSPCDGVVEEIFIKMDSKVYEWEKLFTIRRTDGELITVATGICGTVESIEVQQGDQVIPGMVLAYIIEEICANPAD